MKCPNCQAELALTGKFWVCPEHGLVRTEPQPAVSSLVQIVDNLLESHLRRQSLWDERLSNEEKSRLKQALLRELETRSKGKLSGEGLIRKSIELICDELLEGTPKGSITTECISAGMPREIAVPLVDGLHGDLGKLAERRNQALPSVEKGPTAATEAALPGKRWWRFWKS